MPLVAFAFATAGGSLAVIDFWCSLIGPCYTMPTMGFYFVDGIIGFGVATVLWWHFRDEWRFP